MMLAEVVALLFSIFFVLSLALADCLGGVEETGQLTKTLYADLLEELNGAHLRIAATNFPNTLIIQKNPDGTFSYSGYAVDFVQYMADLFHFNYSFVHTRLEDLEKLGARDTEVNFLLRDEADIAVTRIAVVLQIFRQLDISIPLFRAGLALLVPWPEEESRLLAPIRPFQPTVWSVLFIALPMMALTMCVFPGIYDKIFGNVISNPSRTFFSVRKFGDRFYAGVANITGHTGNWPARKQFFSRILLGSWCLAVLVLVHAYSSLLISYLTIPTLMPAAKNYDDLVFNPIFKNLGLISEKNSIKRAMMEAAINDRSGSIGLDKQSKLARRAKSFADMFEKHPEWLFTNTQQRFDLMYTGRVAFSLTEPLSYSLLDELNKKAGYCKITISNKNIEDLMYSSFVFLYKKHWRYTDSVRNKYSI